VKPGHNLLEGFTADSAVTHGRHASRVSIQFTIQSVQPVQHLAWLVVLDPLVNPAHIIVETGNGVAGDLLAILMTYL
jgi:hypothetical protein